MVAMRPDGQLARLRDENWRHLRGWFAVDPGPSNRCVGTQGEVTAPGSSSAHPGGPPIESPGEGP
jgi:hypothetical protein